MPSTTESWTSFWRRRSSIPIASAEAKPSGVKRGGSTDVVCVLHWALRFATNDFLEDAVCHLTSGWLHPVTLTIGRPKKHLKKAECDGGGAPAWTVRRSRRISWRILSGTVGRGEKWGCWCNYLVYSAYMKDNNNMMINYAIDHSHATDSDKSTPWFSLPEWPISICNYNARAAAMIHAGRHRRD